MGWSNRGLAAAGLAPLMLLNLVVIAAGFVLGCSSSGPLLADYDIPGKVDAGGGSDCHPGNWDARSRDAARGASDHLLSQDGSGSCLGPFSPHSGPADQYSNIEGLRDTDLIAALEQRTTANVQSLSYDQAKTALFSADGIDVHNGQVECVYTGQLFSPDQLDRSGGFNTEHSWPQSEFSGSTSSEKSDMHHLFAGEQKINSCRSSFKYGDTNQLEPKCSAGGSGRGPAISSSDTVFMVRTARRGDIARAHFYFSVRYHLSISSSEETVLRCWHHQDPPDADERARNDAIEGLQHNRNPFVDRPEFVDYISNF